MQDTILRLPSVEKVTGLKKSAIYRHIASGDFPAQVKITQRASGWRSSEIEAWIASRQSTAA